MTTTAKEILLAPICLLRRTLVLLTWLLLFAGLLLALLIGFLLIQPIETEGQAHYVTLQLVDGKTADGLPVSLAVKDHVRASGYLRDIPYSESLATFLRKAGKYARVQDGDDDVRVGRVATYVVVETLVRFQT